MGLYVANLSVGITPGVNVRRGEVLDIEDDALAEGLMRRGWLRPYREPYRQTHPTIPPSELPAWGGPGVSDAETEDDRDVDAEALAHEGAAETPDEPEDDVDEDD